MFYSSSTIWSQALHCSPPPRSVLVRLPAPCAPRCLGRTIVRGHRRPACRNTSIQRPGSGSPEWDSPCSLEEFSGPLVDVFTGKPWKTRSVLPNHGMLTDVMGQRPMVSFNQFEVPHKKYAADVEAWRSGEWKTAYVVWLTHSNQRGAA